MRSSELAIAHWDKTPLNVSEQERYEIYPWLYEAAEFCHHKGHQVLEIGCGAGADLRQFAKHGAIATGIDITPAHVRLAQERVGDRARVFLARGDAIPFPDESFDYVYSCGVLHHIDQPRQVVEEIFRVLRPHGRFNVIVYASRSLYRLELVLRYGRKWRLYAENSRDPVHIDVYTAHSLRKLFAPAPIRIQKYECYRAPFLQRWFGWFLIVKGGKPNGVSSGT